MGASHTGKTESLGTLPGKSVLFNFDGTDNVSSLRVPYAEVLRLEDYWVDPFEFGKILVVNYSAIQREIPLEPVPRPTVAKNLCEFLIKDVNSIGKNLEKLASEEGQGNIIFETLGSMGEVVLDYIVASNGRGETQIQDYRPAMRKVMSILGAAMSFGLNVIVTGHLQTDRDEITQRGKILPLIWGKVMPEAIPRVFGEVFQSVIISDGRGGIKYQWLTRPDPGGFIDFLGSRKHKNLPKYIDQDYGYIDKLTRELETTKGGKK